MAWTYGNGTTYSHDILFNSISTYILQISSLYVGKTYVASDLLLNAGSLKVLISDSEVSLHLLQSLGGNDVDAQALLSLGKAQPKLAPGRVAGTLAEETSHLTAAVAARERGLISVVRALLRALSLELLDLLLQLGNLRLSVLGLVNHVGQWWGK